MTYDIRDMIISGKRSEINFNKLIGIFKLYPNINEFDFSTQELTLNDTKHILMSITNYFKDLKIFELDFDLQEYTFSLVKYSNVNFINLLILIMFFNMRPFIQPGFLYF